MERGQAELRLLVGRDLPRPTFATREGDALAPARRRTPVPQGVAGIARMREVVARRPIVVQAQVRADQRRSRLRRRWRPCWLTGGRAGSGGSVHTFVSRRRRGQERGRLCRRRLWRPCRPPPSRVPGVASRSIRRCHCRGQRCRGIGRLARRRRTATRRSSARPSVVRSGSHGHGRFGSCGPVDDDGDRPCGTWRHHGNRGPG